MSPRTPLLDRLLPDAPPFVVFGITLEREAAQAHLAALLIGQGRALDVTRHRYAFSLGLATGGDGASDGATAYVHYFEDPEGALVPVTTAHSPGVDDLGGLVRPTS